MIDRTSNSRSLTAPPTDDVSVKRWLRELDQPAIYFGEGPAERRERLRKLLTDLTPEEQFKLKTLIDPIKSIENRDQEQAFYYEGSEQLKVARLKIAAYSIEQSSARLDMARIKQLEPLTTRLIPQQDLIEKIRRFDDPELHLDEDISSNDLKRFNSCNFNTNADLLCTSSRSGKCKIWSVPDMETKIILKGHESNAKYIIFSPKSSDNLSARCAHLASCSTDGSILMWNLEDEQPVCVLSDQQAFHVNRVRYHPTGNYLASCCSDKSWRLWDLESKSEILHQEGHSKSVSDIAFHLDGSLAASAGMDTYARVWDLRTGRCIRLLEGHAEEITTIDFSPDGYHLASGGFDNTVKIWNLRQRKLEYTIPAHLQAVTTVKFEKKNGYCLATASMDKTIKFWSSQTCAPIKTLDAYDGTINGIDLSEDSDLLISCYSKYLKLWTNKCL